MHSTSLTGAPWRTYHELMENSSAANAPWSEVRALLEALAELTVDASGNLTATRNRHVLTLHPALTRHIAESGELNALRRFLRDSESSPTATAARDPHLLLVIHGTEARLYRCQVIGGVPQLVLPYEAAVPNPEDRTARSRPRAAKAPNSEGFYVPMADELQAAGQILIFDAGTGGEAATFVAWLSQHDSELAGRIIGTVRLDVQLVDHAALLVAARKFYGTLVSPPHPE